MNLREKFFGDRKFYARAAALAVPIIVQNGITNLVNLLDNVMVGRLGTEQMSGVSIVNQFIFVFNLLVFGAISGAGIFSVQFHGNKDSNGVRHTLRFKIYVNLLLSVLAVAIMAIFSDGLISTFLFENGAEGDLALTLAEGKAYLRVIVIGLIPYALSQVYASTLRETEHALVPMVASIVAVGTNFVLNYVLIFGAFGFPALGVTGAAIATVVSRFAELAILVVWSHANTKRCPCFKGMFHSFSIPAALVGKMIKKGLPLVANEFLWAMSMTLRNQCYATRGIDAVAAQNINSTIFNLFSVVYMAFGTVISIMVGALLGQGKFQEAKDTNRKLLVCSLFCGVLLGGTLAACSGLFPEVYNTGAGVKGIATYMMIVTGVFMPFYAYSHNTYFTIRSGGNVAVTFIMDSGYMCLFVLPLSYLLSKFTSMDIFTLFILCQGAEILKAPLSFYLLKKGTWAKRLVENQ